MRSVGFLRNPWKKREQKLADSRDNTENSRRTAKKTTDHSTNGSAVAGHSMTVKVECLPPDLSTASRIEGSWSYQHPSPIQGGASQKRSERTLVRRDSSRLGLDVTYRAHGAMISGGQKLSRASNSSPQQASTEAPSKKHSVRSPLPTTRNATEVSVFSANHPTLPRQSSSPFSPQSPRLPSFPLLPPIDLDCGPGNDKLWESKTCQRPQALTSTRHDCCSKSKFSEARRSTSTTLHSTHKTVNAVLDWSADAKPRTLYWSTGSTPHLPYHEQIVSPVRPESSECSGENSEPESFPLSLFPLPPPLLVRKKIPAPLVLRSGLPSSAVSSRDSTPIGTPTTPRFQSLNSPSQSSIASPKKFHMGRTSVTFSPPPTSPPNSPLPDLPPSRNLSTDKLARTLKISQSNANLRGALPYPATHRLTSSEPISDHSSLPIKRPMKPRPDPVRVQDSHTYMFSGLERTNVINKEYG
ncbi:hypothetical protein M413DRAFT_24052 [Hebeloma cylindrosporum]|uniref:Uncharacterized protein n=1 Tax=Hebeloma cylindrosporum TaxID=76867 RepID=A0A0C3CQC5_HEBCY|nr:hypothetical protein M413DRAFT_24052 [Hebeloma cylindrosporum h7]